MRVGIGYDAHRFCQDTPCDTHGTHGTHDAHGAHGTRCTHVTLGGVQIPHERRLEGHSDADVLVHAAMDAVLGAAGGPDIGVLFPNTDMSLSGISSLILASRTAEYIRAKGYRIAQIDCTLIAEAPRVSPHRQAMAHLMSRAFGVEASMVCVKATTNEGMGFIGRGEGIAAMAVATLEPIATLEPVQGDPA